MAALLAAFVLVASGKSEIIGAARPIRARKT